MHPMAEDDTGELHRTGLNDSDGDDDLFLGVAVLPDDELGLQQLVAHEEDRGFGHAGLSGSDVDSHPAATELAMVAVSDSSTALPDPGPAFDIHDFKNIHWSKDIVLAWFGGCTREQYELLSAIVSNTAQGKWFLDSIKRNEVLRQLGLYLNPHPTLLSKTARALVAQTSRQALFRFEPVLAAWILLMDQLCLNAISVQVNSLSDAGATPL